MVTRDEFKEAQTFKLDYCIFRDYEKMMSADRTQELKNFSYEEKLFNLERALNNYVMIEDNVMELRNKVSFDKLDELKDSFNKLQNINVTMEENLSQKLTDLKEDFETKTKEIIDNIEDLNKKMDEIDEEEGSYDDESEQDLDSELGDTLDVNDMNRTVMGKDKESSDDASPKTGNYKSNSTSNDPVNINEKSDNVRSYDEEFSVSNAAASRAASRGGGNNEPLTPACLPAQKRNSNSIGGGGTMTAANSIPDEKIGVEKFDITQEIGTGDISPSRNQ